MRARQPYRPVRSSSVWRWLLFTFFTTEEIVHLTITFITSTIKTSKLTSNEQDPMAIINVSYVFMIQLPPFREKFGCMPANMIIMSITNIYAVMMPLITF